MLFVRSFILNFDSICNVHQEANDPRLGPDDKTLELLKAFDKVQPRNRQKKSEDDRTTPAASDGASLGTLSCQLDSQSQR